MSRFKIDLETDIRGIVEKHLEQAIYEIERKHQVYLHLGFDKKLREGLKRGIGLVVLNFTRAVLRG